MQSYRFAAVPELIPSMTETASEQSQTPSSKPIVDLVVPVYNEAHVLAGSIERLLTATADFSARFIWRIVIVNNGSTDTTRDVALELERRHEQVRLLHLTEKGRGRALRRTWETTDAEYSIYMDVDLSTDIEAIPRVVDQLDAGADLVTGSRLDPKSEITRCRYRDILSRGYNQIIRLSMRTQTFDDAQCGFKGIRVETVRSILPLVENDEWFFDTELLILAEWAGLEIRSIPVRWVEDRDSRVNVPMTILEDLKGLARLRLNGRYLIKQWRDAR